MEAPVISVCEDPACRRSNPRSVSQAVACVDKGGMVPSRAGCRRAYRGWPVIVPVFALIVLTGVARILAETPPAIAPTIIRDLPYVPHGHERQKLDLYIPGDVAAEAPLLVWIHGGAWKEGGKENSPAVGMMGKGWVVASLNYRFSQHAIFPAQLEDCKAALRFMRAHAADYHIDTNRVAVWGASAGGHLVALLGVTGRTREFDVGENLEQSSAVSCVIDWFGPTDFLHWGGGSSVKPNNKDDVIAKLFGGPVPEHLELARKGSPITWVGKDSAPILIMHGDKDPLVPLQQSETFAAALAKAGVPCVLKVYPGQGHGGPRFNDEAARKMMIDFVEKHTAPPAAK